jgi:hypothetical protein
MKYVTLIVLLVALTACVPVVQDTRPKVAFVNAPTEDRVSGLAQTLESTLKTQETSFGFSRASALRFQETHRDMYGSRAALQAAYIARSQGARYAVMVSFDNAGDTVSWSLSGNRIDLTLRLNGRARASIVDPVSADILGTFDSSEVVAEQHETVTLVLPEGITPLDPRAKPYIAQQVAEAKERALGRFLSDNSEGVVGELAEPLRTELSRLVSSPLAMR